MKISKLILFILFFYNACLGQNLIKGYIKDKISNKSIPFASISLKNHTIGVYTNEEGLFDLTIIIPIDDIKDSLLVGCLGYEKITISLNDIKKRSQILLTPVDYKLPEITITPKRKSKIITTELGFHTKKPNRVYTSGSITKEGNITAIFIENSIFGNAYIKELIFRLEPHYHEEPAIIKVHLYEKDQYSADLKPSNELILENLFITVSPKTKNLKVDVQKYNIQMPDSGVFVGLEWVKGRISNKHVSDFSLSGVAPVYRNTQLEPSIIMENKIFKKFMGQDWVLHKSIKNKRDNYIPMFGLSLYVEKE